MTLDSWMVARLGRELHAVLAGARIEQLDAGPRMLVMECRHRGKRLWLIASFEPERPLAAVVSSQPNFEADANEQSGRVHAGWAGGVAPLLRAAKIEGVHAVASDRILNVDVVSRSSFGVPARHRLVLELEPRKANALIVRPREAGDGIILAVAKRVRGLTGARALEVGQAYELPPPRRKELDEERFRSAVLAAAVNAQPRVLARLLGQYDPDCTPPLARDVVERSLFAVQEHAISEAAQARSLADELLPLWHGLRRQVEAAAADDASQLYAWRRGTEIVACHFVPLAWPAGDPFAVRSLNELSADQLRSAKRPGASSEPLRRKLELMLSRCRTEIEELTAARVRAQKSDSLRAEGDAIYANLSRIEPGDTVLVTDDGTRVALDPLLTAKQNAADYFRRYRKARSGLPRVQARLTALEANREYWEHLLWELDRAQTDPELRQTIVEDVGIAIGGAGRNRGKKRAAARGKKPTAWRGKPEAAGIAVSGGAVAFVGRSPKDNERLTFTVARPNDLWFHARGIPGAHVILKMPAGSRASSAQIEQAAALAAGSSRAAHAHKVEVDYTQRKHVRRRGAGRTGLVWYTNFSTVLVSPVARAQAATSRA